MEARRCQDGFGGVPQPPRLLLNPFPSQTAFGFPPFVAGPSRDSQRPPPSRPLSYGKRRGPISAAASASRPSIRSSAARRRGGLNAAVWLI